MANLENKLLNAVSKKIHKAENTSKLGFLVALSGGVDSCVLLFAMNKLFSDKAHKIRAVHINHNINKDADRWQEFNEKFCASLGIEIQVKNIHLDSASNLEEKARIERYKAIKTVVGDNEILLLGHHRNDAIETFFYRTMRGCGVNGGFMKSENLYDRMSIFRPMLDISKQEIEQYAIDKKIAWVEDNSNSNNDFDRNFIRNMVVSPIEKTKPEKLKNLARSMAFMSEQGELLKEYVAEHLSKITSEEKKTIDISGFGNISEIMGKNLIYYWLSKLNIVVSSQKQVQEIFNLTINMGRNAHILCKSKNFQGVTELFLVKVFAGKLYLLPEHILHIKPINFTYNLTLNAKDDKIPLPFGSLIVQANKDLKHKLNCNIKFRKGGEKCMVNSQHKSLKKLMQLWKIPPWLRDITPLLFDGEVLFCIPGYFCHKEYAIADKINCNVVWNID